MKRITGHLSSVFLLHQASRGSGSQCLYPSILAHLPASISFPHDLMCSRSLSPPPQMPFYPVLVSLFSVASLSYPSVCRHYSSRWLLAHACMFRFRLFVFFRMLLRYPSTHYNHPVHIHIGILSHCRRAALCHDYASL